MEYVRKTSLNSYKFLNELLPILFNKNNNLFMHNKKRLEYLNPSENTFEGKMICGGSSYLLNYYLKKRNTY